MAKLTARSMIRMDGKEGAQPPVPKRIERSHAGREKHFEDWIEYDVALIGEGLKVIGRQAGVAVILRGCSPASAGGADP